MYSIIFFGLFSSTISAPLYSNYEQYVQFEIVKKTTTILYNTSIPPSTTTINVVVKAEIISNKINEYITSFKILIPSIFAVLLTLYTVVIYTIKFYKNNCTFKRSWFTIKAPKEYQRRRHRLHEQQIALDQISHHIQETSHAIYSIT